MKKIFNIMAVAAMSFGIAACQIESEDAFSTDPVAPELDAHSNILMTSNTMDEDVTFSWSKARFMGEGNVEYSLYMTYDEKDVLIGQTTDLFYTTSKTNFQTLVKNSFPAVPENSTFTLSFYVTAATPENVTISNDLTLSVYSYGNAVAAIATATVESIVLDPAEPTSDIAVFYWEDARLVYGEAVTYDAYVRIGETSYLLAEGIDGNSYATTVDELNEAVVAAGGTEAEANEAFFYVIAKCASIPDGVASNEAKVVVTTYVSTFPDVLYIPGSHQGWNPATAPTIKQSSAQKGFYEGVVDLTTEDGADVSFKFSPVPDWKDDFGGKVTINEEYTAGHAASGTVGVSDNITVPSGVYNITLNKKLNTIQLVEVKTLSLIGSVYGNWDKDLELTYDAAAKTFSGVGTLTAGAFKFRFNNDWKYSMGGTLSAVSASTGDNIDSTVEGEYKVVLNVGSVPYTVKFINTSFPDNVYLVGSFNGWNEKGVKLTGNGEGQYEGFQPIGGEWGWKILPTSGTWDGQYGSDGSEGKTDEKGNVTYGITSNGGNIMESSTGYYKVVVNMAELTTTVTPITSVGIIGGFDGNNWSSDYAPLTYDEDSKTWKASGVEIAKNTAWKFRMNEAWDVNLGGDLNNLVQDGSNIVEAEGSVYDIELDINTTPYKATLTKKGSVTPTNPETMYIIGDAVGGWDWSTNAVDMIPVNGVSGGFWAIRYIEAGKGFKFCSQKAWSGDFASLGNDTGFTVEGGNCYVSETGLYTIGIDYAKNKIVVEKAQVYGIGDCFGGWDSAMASALFTVGADGKAVSPELSAGEVRMYAASSCFTSDWWTREFIILDGKIAYRGNGGDQERVSASAGQKVTLDFNAGTGSIK